MSAIAVEQRLRIGDVARLLDTTPRTIRYYEQLGLLAPAEDRGPGKHRTYEADDVERLREILRMRDLLGLPLEDIRELIEAEEARAELRREWEAGPGAARRRKILEESLGHIGRQLELVRSRRRELSRLEDELVAKRRRVRRRLTELD